MRNDHRNFAGAVAGPAPAIRHGVPASPPDVFGGRLAPVLQRKSISGARKRHAALMESFERAAVTDRYDGRRR